MTNASYQDLLHMPVLSFSEKNCVCVVVYVFMCLCVCERNCAGVWVFS